ncbi:uncharacterized protein LOC131598916 [Vicia villosa]|uniref:uncharacterized protein LOC131598916 n=1 Tax=Vicia villosa TaxID=3911 RepID=UPI00273C51F0|nr:uncharacterized protein LOC131598916 [Vicia villosa]
MAIEPSKDEDQFGAIEESKIKIGIDGWRNWGGWSSIGRRRNNGGENKEGGQVGVAKEKGEQIESGKDNKTEREDEDGHIGEDWDLRGTRSWKL